MNLAALSLALIAALPADGPEPPAVGAPAPRLSPAELLQAPKGAGVAWADLKGQVVVIEFWATWCGPCVEAIPHLHDLAERFRGRPVRFLAITDEEPRVIRRFLEKTPMKAWVGLAGEATFEAYGVRERPLTVVVDAAGRVAARTTPNNITPELIDAVLAGEAGAISRPIARLEIRPYLGKAGVHREEPAGGGLRMTNVGLRPLLSYAHRVPLTRIDARMPLPDQAFDVDIEVAGADRKALRPLLSATIEATFRLRATLQPREADVLVLRRAPGKEPPPPAAGELDQLRSSPGSYSATRRTMGEFALDLEGMLGRPVVDETGLAGACRVDVRWNRGELESTAAALRDQLGLDLVPETRRLPFLVVEPQDGAGR
ncbi:Thiol-disulfide oxidoreductase ResA [Aquisphaera giovannonii]|uniref:Thiol-disulfide oxidoreductase ResA n=1 Tax=Aquisphaera giovannonii TaxID=406548 RepID=A0A5B9W7F9_9BACT|nr:TIGR03435 family protein [Aquisphaera giovannonii]QEH36184.1 Thiol-disulfide oxidoreductase ResA [Aquisphaera giovannonii]